VNSFRLKLALLTGIIAAILLIGAGAFAWRLTLRFNLDRLDRELRNVGAANLERVVGDSHWQRVDSALRFVSGPDRPPGFAIWAANYDREIYRSPHWPAGLAPEQFAAPTIRRRRRRASATRSRRPIPRCRGRSRILSPPTPLTATGASA
jgi:hypothetical protein